MTTATELFGPTLAKAIELKATEVIFIGDQAPQFKFGEDSTFVLPDSEPINLREMRLALNTIGGVQLGVESVHKGWFTHEGEKFDLDIFHEPERTGASFRHVKQTDAPEVEKTATPVDLPTNIPTF